MFVFHYFLCVLYVEVLPKRVLEQRQKARRGRKGSGRASSLSLSSNDDSADSLVEEEEQEDEEESFYQENRKKPQKCLFAFRELIYHNTSNN